MPVGEKPAPIVAKLEAADIAKRSAAVALAAVGVVIFVIGVKWFANLVTESFSSFGYAAVPLGAMMVGIFLIPLQARVHRLWMSGSPARRAADQQRLQKEESRFRVASSQAGRKKYGPGADAE